MNSDYIIVDGNNIAYRSDCVMELSTPDGIRTSAIFGFIKSLRGYIDKFNPEGVVTCWDSRCAWRREVYADYKGNRSKERTDDEKERYTSFIYQVEELRKILPMLGVSQIKVDGFEADDLMYESRYILGNSKVVIVSGDKDLAQLVDENTIHYLVRKESKIITMKNFKGEFGVDPENWVFFRAVVGDSSDNIKGVPGVAEKTTIKLLEKYNNDPIKAMKDKKISGHLDTIARNLRLMVLDRAVDTEIKPKVLFTNKESIFTDCKLDLEGFRKKCFELGFNRILGEFSDFVLPFVKIQGRKGK